MESSSGLRILRMTHVRRSGFQMPSDTYDGWVLLTPAEGAFRYEITGGAFGEAAFGDIVFCPPGFALRREALTPTITFVFCEFLPLSAEDFSLSAGVVSIRDATRLASTLRLLRTALRCPEPERIRWGVHLLTDLLFLADMTRRTAGKAKEVEPDSVMNTVAQRLTEAKNEETVAEIARRVGLSPSRLTRRFTEAMGQTPSEYRTAHRLERVRSLLTETDWTLERIAGACGFRDAFYLSRVFRRIVGVPPSEYRQRHRI